MSHIDLVPAGVILPYGGATAPSGWVLCDGAEYDTTGKYARLYAAIGTAFGTSGAGKFNVPDTRGKFLRGVDHGAGNDPDRATRTGSTGGNTGDNVGSLQAGQIEAHVHNATYSFTGSADGQAMSSATGSNYQVAWESSGGDDFPARNTSSTGGNQTNPINIGVEYIIKL